MNKEISRSKQHDILIDIAIEWWLENVREELKPKMIEYLTSYLAKYAKQNIECTISTGNYAPQYPLSEACRIAGHNGFGFHPNTTMWVNFKEGTIKTTPVGGRPEQVYPALGQTS